jgi:hypothetical protein
MHVITDCPRCKESFMYHTTDTYLFRDITMVDEAGINEIVTEVICHLCDLSEKFLNKEVKVVEKNPHEHLNEFKLTVVDILTTPEDFPIVVKIGESDSFEFFEEKELKIQENVIK